jgi:Tfp pilus assembly protein PilX
MGIKNSKSKIQKGFAALYLAILVLALVFGIAISISFLTLGQQRISRNITKSTQAYYIAEAGIEDALIRLKNKLNFSSPYSFKVGDGTSTVEISSIIGGSRTITSTGNSSNRVRKIRVGYSVSTQQVSFHYGAQVGEGGMLMGNNSRVRGNIYSNGSVIPAMGGDKGYIDETIIVAINGNRIEGLIVGEDAKAHTCKDSQITGTLTYVSGGSVQNCTAGESIKTQPNEIPAKDLPIPQSQIDKWKSEAESGGIISGDYTISGKITQNLGPVKITGNLLVDNNATLNMMGTIWVVGNLRIDNGSTIKLDSDSYGPLSGVIVVDGKIKVRPNTYLKGSGQEGSYLMLLSTNPEVLDTANPAIDVDNNTDAAIFYTTQGLIVLRNKIKAREVTGYKIFLDNNAEILYEAGLEEATFSSGPGGSWEVVSWREIE